MNPIDIIVVIAILVAVGAALFYIIRAKKKGRRCIGCPDADRCGGNCNGASFSCTQHRCERNDSEKE